MSRLFHTNVFYTQSCMLSPYPRLIRRCACLMCDRDVLEWSFLWGSQLPGRAMPLTRRRLVPGRKFSNISDERNWMHSSVHNLAQYRDSSHVLSSMVTQRLPVANTCQSRSPACQTSAVMPSASAKSKRRTSSASTSRISNSASARPAQLCGPVGRSAPGGGGGRAGTHRRSTARTRRRCGRTPRRASWRARGPPAASARARTPRGAARSTAGRAGLPRRQRSVVHGAEHVRA
jgi:hypothetical protein